jgi:hypothetical protein
VACHATTDADIEVVVAGSTIGDVLHLNLAQNHSKDAEKAVHGVALPMFQDAAALALDGMPMIRCVCQHHQQRL